jgi:hypothetical protein
MIVTEAFSMVALSAAMLPVNERPTPEMCVGVLDSVKKLINARVMDEYEDGRLTGDGINAAKDYADDLLARFSEYLVPKARAA